MLQRLVTDITRVTHSNKRAVNGAILECSAVQIALRSRLSDTPLYVDQMVTELLDRMQRLEGLYAKSYSLCNAAEIR